MIKCPHCGKSHYRELYSESTCLGWYPVFENGKLVSEDPNIHTTHCECLECNQQFFVVGGEVKPLNPASPEIKETEPQPYDISGTTWGDLSLNIFVPPEPYTCIDLSKLGKCLKVTLNGEELEIPPEKIFEFLKSFMSNH